MKLRTNLQSQFASFKRHSPFFKAIDPAGLGLLLLLALLGLASLSCSKSNDLDKVGEAEYCLDDATTDTALDCVAKVDGINSPAANNIRCAGHFLYEGLTDTRNLLDALDALSESTSDPIQTFMGFLIFDRSTSTGTNKSNASEAFNYCLNSGAKAATLIASFTYLATSLLHGYEAENMDPTVGNNNTEKVGIALAYVLANIVASEASSAHVIPDEVNNLFSAFGSVVISTNNISCNSSKVNDELCGYMKTSIEAGGADPILVGRTFFKTIAQADNGT